MPKSIVHVADTVPVAATAYTVTNRSVLLSFAKEIVHLQHEEDAPCQLEHESIERWFVSLRFDHDAFISYARQINEAAQLLLSAMKQPPNEGDKQDTVLEKYAAMYEDKVNEDDKQPPQDQDADQHAKDTAKATAKDETAHLDRREGKLTSVSQASREKREEDFLAGVADIRRNNSY